MKTIYSVNGGEYSDRWTGPFFEKEEDAKNYAKIRDGVNSDNVWVSEEIVYEEGDQCDAPIRVIVMPQTLNTLSRSLTKNL